MRTHLFERSSERPNVRVRQVLREVSFDSVAVVAAGLFHCLGAFVGEDDEYRAAIMLGAKAMDESFLFHSVDDTGEAALAVEDPLGELGHRDAFG